MITPYKYRFTIGKDNPRSMTGRHIIVYDGVEREVEPNSIEFNSEHKLTFQEFQNKIKGTIGVTHIYGEFVEEYREELIKFIMFQNLLNKDEAVKKVDNYLKCVRDE